MYRYKSLIDNALVFPLAPKEGLKTWEIQVRQDNKGIFKVYYTNGYKYNKFRYATGYNYLKRVIKEIKESHINK